MAGCYAMKHTVGNGAQGSTTTSERQWYILFGLVPLNNVDSKQMAGDAKDYEVTTSFEFVDLVIGVFTGIISVQPMTVTVKK